MATTRCGPPVPRSSCGAAAGLRLGIELGEVFVGPGPRGADTVTGAAITAAAPAGRTGRGRRDPARRRRCPAVAADATIDPAALLELRRSAGAAPGAVDPVRRPRDGARAAPRDVRGRRAMSARAGSSPSWAPPGIGKSRLSRRVRGHGRRRDGAGRPLPVLRRGHDVPALADIVRAGATRGHDRRAARRRRAGHPRRARRSELSVEPARSRRRRGRCAGCSSGSRVDRPLVLVVEDIHWAQPPLLDLIDHVATLSSGAPILIVCLTRPELLERAPGVVGAAAQPLGARSRRARRRAGAGARRAPRRRASRRARIAKPRRGQPAVRRAARGRRRGAGRAASCR